MNSAACGREPRFEAVHRRGSNTPCMPLRPAGGGVAYVGVLCDYYRTKSNNNAYGYTGSITGDFDWNEVQVREGDDVLCLGARKGKLRPLLLLAAAGCCPHQTAGGVITHLPAACRSVAASSCRPLPGAATADQQPEECGVGHQVRSACCVLHQHGCSHTWGEQQAWLVHGGF